MLDVQKASYFYATASNQPGASLGVLEELTQNGVNLLGFTATPVGPVQTQYTLFPEDPVAFERIAGRAGLQVNGPHHAILLRGEDKIGAIEAVYRRLESAHIHAYSSTGIVGSRGAFSLLLYVRPTEVDAALDALAS